MTIFLQNISFAVQKHQAILRAIFDALPPFVGS